MDKQFTGCLLVTAFINLILSSILIPSLGVYGAVVGTIIAEFVCSIVQIIICRSIISIARIARAIFPYILSGLIMYGVIFAVKSVYNQTVAHLLIQILIGGITYSIICMGYIFLFSDIKSQAKQEVRKGLHRVFKC